VRPFTTGLTEAEAERLALLAEEMGEAIQSIGKVLRHGYESCHPKGGPTNRHLLEAECGDVLAALELLYWARDIGREGVELARAEKHFAVRPYLHHQADARKEEG
jgi:hypothetical protein